MTIIHAGNATIEISKDGEHWQPIHGFQAIQSWDETALPSPLSGVRDGIERSRSIMGMTVTWFNRGMFDALVGTHTRHAMRYRKLSGYRRCMGLDKRRS